MDLAAIRRWYQLAKEMNLRAATRVCFFRYTFESAIYSLISLLWTHMLRKGFHKKQTNQQ